MAHDSDTKRSTLTPEQVAADLQIGVWVVRRLAKNGTLPGFKVGRQWRFDVDAYADWKAERTAAVSREADWA